MGLVCFDFPTGTELAALTTVDSLQDTYSSYFLWGVSKLNSKAYKKGYSHAGPFEIIKDDKVEAKCEGGTDWIFRGKRVNFSYSSFRKARIWRCSEFGSLQIVNILHFSVIYLRGKEVGKYQSVGGILSDYIKRRVYVKRCKERGIKPKEEPQNHFLELDVGKLGDTLSMFLLLHIYYSDIYMG